MNTLSRSSGKGQEKICDASRLAEAISQQSHDLEEANNLITGSAQVMDSLKELRDVSAEVQTGSGEMNGGNRNILEAIEELSGISREVPWRSKRSITVWRRSIGR
ncbi:MAG: hypothetical protein JXA95_03610 [Spirochaetales bacterium]|nr:hypothetical protein [Spirochaetales bacterium]